MLEWLKRHAWKACIRQKRIRGSNPRLSAGKAGIQSAQERAASNPRLSAGKAGIQSAQERAVSNPGLSAFRYNTFPSKSTFALNFGFLMFV